MDCSAIVLHKLLQERNLDAWARLKLVFLDPSFSSLYSAISKYYDTYSAIPSFDELELVLRDGPALSTLSILKLADEPDVSIEVALDALLDQYTQNETIRQLDKFIDKLPQYDTAEIKENLSSIVLRLDEKTLSTTGVFNMAGIMLFRSSAELANDRVHLGLNNTFDATLAGCALQELILVGGPRGSGKSIVCNNIMVNQYEAGNTCPYFTIEMTGQETFERTMSIAANVSYQQLKQNTLSDSDMLKVISARAGMFQDSTDLVDQWRQHRDRFKFELELVRTKALKEDNQLIIIDDRALTLTSLDLHLGKIKSKFGDKFKVAVVDYLNKIIVEGLNPFDWQTQITVSSKLKDLCRKHNIVIFSPYQIDATGEARFAKGILDAADIALVMEPQDKADSAMGFRTTKIRGGPDMAFMSPMSWDSLRISPQSLALKEPETKEKKKSKTKPTAVDDTQADLPPW